MKTTIDMARESGLFVARENPRYYGASLDSLKAFEALVRADEREETNRRANASWTMMCEKMVAAEREACAKECKFDRTSADIEIAIRARGTHDRRI
jgi:hypothetical protein